MLCLVALGVAVATAALPGGLTILDDATISVNGKTWFNPGNISVTVGGVTYSTADGSLKTAGATTSGQGSSAIGSYTSTTNHWLAGSTKFETTISNYGAAFSIYTQMFPDGAAGTMKEGEVSSCFPSIDPTPATDDPLGFVSWQGRFMEASRGGVWGSGQGGQPGVGTGDAGGPFVVFGEDQSESLVFSPVANFMTNTPGAAPATGGPDAAALSKGTDSSFCYGLDGPVESVPVGYSLETMIFYGSGVNSAMKAFGTTLLKYHGTTRSVDWVAQHLGFSTDNGAYYYYNTAPGKFAPGREKENYQQTLLDVHTYAEKENIPYKHVLLDSWWYTKGVGGGLKEWDATNSTFPDGLKSFAEQTGWRFQMHNRMWSDNNIYARQNGGKYGFVVEPNAEPGNKSQPGTSGLSIPTDQALWDDLIANKTNNGIPISVYEQDWMYNEWQGLKETRSSPTLSRQWLMQMGEGALKSNVTVQYCMTFARMVLQTAEIPAVTTFRASDDYGPGQTGYYPHANNPDGEKGCGFPYCVYYVGTTSILAYAMQLKPSKDNYWSTPVQPGSAFNHQKYPSFYNDTIEPYNEMQGAISAYTTAMVAPSDGVGYSNASLIKMACSAGGLLLQPCAPARAIDASFALSNGPEPRVKNVHAVMATHSKISGATWTHVLVIGLNKSWSLSPAHLGDDFDETADQLVWSGYKPSDTTGHGGNANITVREARFSATAPLELQACGYADFGLWHTAPIWKASGAAFLGEVGKWVPVAAARVSSVVDSKSGLTVGVVGVAGETVELAFAVGTMVYTAVCQVGSGGTATATFAGESAKC